jgi:uncharacterized membrane protein
LLELDEPGRRLLWRSVEGADVKAEGLVIFRPGPLGETTDLDVSLEYAPPSEINGRWLTKLFGEDPELVLREDLRRFKAIVETGVVPTIEGQPSGRLSMGVQGRRGR